MSKACCFEANEHNGEDERGQGDRPTPGPTCNETKRRCFAEEDHEKQYGPKHETNVGDDKPVPGGTRNEPSEHDDEDNDETTRLLDEYERDCYLDIKTPIADHTRPCSFRCPSCTII